MRHFRLGRKLPRETECFLQCDYAEALIRIGFFFPADRALERERNRAIANKRDRRFILSREGKRESARGSEGKRVCSAFELACAFLMRVTRRYRNPLLRRMPSAAHRLAVSGNALSRKSADTPDFEIAKHFHTLVVSTLCSRARARATFRSLPDFCLSFFPLSAHTRAHTAAVA